ncbi:aqualysin-1-like [Saccoglossus kowalevskii]|uniref:Alkaline serine protease ver112-like n=1 Tax=Saccoglossus kowalevskii TaxID=10224 RepID=A0ABM0H109_SACKO|nr:PREDICTED: alkaline serine protease ver112-like [Saccoglossus kowalevskii]
MRFVILTLLVAAASAANLVPLYRARDPVKNRYILKVKDDVDLDNVAAKLPSMGIGIIKRFSFAVKGFAVEAQEKTINQLRTMDEFEYIEEDGIYKADVEWGCDRTDQRNLPLDGVAAFNDNGAGTHVYIIDTGLRHTHDEFNGRASFFFDFEPANQGDDCNGHGTHCGGTSVGNSVGIATAASVYSVRVLNCNGAGLTSNIVDGCDAIVAGGQKPGTCNMSIGGGASILLDNAVASLTSDGYVVSVSAGNDDTDACNQSPAREETSITTGSTTSDDERSGFSNYGTCVDIFAPGSLIRSSYHTADNAYTIMSGTSMASPHVVGVAAAMLGGGVCSDHASCKNNILAVGTADVVGSPGIGSPNLLLYCE